MVLKESEGKKKSICGPHTLLHPLHPSCSSGEGGAEGGGGVVEAERKICLHPPSCPPFEASASRPFQQAFLVHHPHSEACADQATLPHPKSDSTSCKLIQLSFDRRWSVLLFSKFRASVATGESNANIRIHSPGQSGCSSNLAAAFPCC